ncbi:MAG: hypothetical protein ACI4B5_02810 [Bacteroidaceae bacterium]
MKRAVFFILTVMLAMACPAYADIIPALSIKTEASEKTISLAEISKVNYTETEMCLTMRDGQVLTLLMDDIVSMKFTELEEQASGISISAETAKRVPASMFLLDGTRAKGNEKNKVIIIKAGKETRKVKK